MKFPPAVSLLALLALSACGFTADRPNIIVMVADDLGWGDVGYHDSRIETPNIDQLAEAGVQLDQFYVQPVCSPTRAALMTGRYPMRLGMQCGVVRPWAEHGLPLDERTLADGLKQAGYTTAVCGKWHLGHVEPAYLPTNRGFDLQYGHYNGALDYFTHNRDGGHDWHQNDKPNYDEGYTTDLIGDAAVRILAQHDKEKPLFLYVPFNAPHTPLQAPEKYLERYKHYKQKNRQTFAAMVTCMDDAIGRIVRAVGEHHYPLDNTLIFFCSDNGGIPRLGSNGQLRAGKGTLYEGGVRVPAIAVWKDRLKAGSIVRQPLHIVDLYPTLLHLAGATLDQDKPIDGKNAWATIAEDAASAHEFILLNLTPFHAAIRIGDWKLVQNGSVTANATEGPETNTWELFNLQTDPAEQRNLIEDEPAVTQRLRARLALLREEAVPPNIPPNRPPQDFKVPEIWGQTAAK